MRYRDITESQEIDRTNAVGEYFVYHATGRSVLAAIKTQGLRAAEWVVRDGTDIDDNDDLNLAPGTYYLLFYADEISDDYGDVSFRFELHDINRANQYNYERGSFFYDTRPWAIDPRLLDVSLDGGETWHLLVDAEL